MIPEACCKLIRNSEEDGVVRKGRVSTPLCSLQIGFRFSTTWECGRLDTSRHGQERCGCDLARATSATYDRYGRAVTSSGWRTFEVPSSDCPTGSIRVGP